jgi:sugar (pentulose or hexulose) kinase
MSEQLILVFDVGTQSARALLVNPRGVIVHAAQKHFIPPYFSPEPGWAEQTPEHYWESICETSRALREKAGKDWDSITAVTCSTIRDTTLCLDKDLNPLGNAILWLDSRKAVNGPPLPRTLVPILKIAGLLDGVHLQRGASHCNWIAWHDKERWAKTHKYVFISAWLNLKLCGTLTDSKASTIGHIPYDARIHDWFRPGDIRWIVFDSLRDKLYDLVDPGSAIGTITGTAAAATGIKPGLPLIATGSDKGCETLGLSCLSSEKAALSFGTTATVQLSTRRYFEPQPHMPAYPAVVPGSYNPEIEIYRGYWLLSWFKKEFAAKEVAEAEQLGVRAETLLDGRLREIPPGCDGLIMQPYFTPGLNMPFAKGAIIGFSDVHTRIHLYRAIIEGINFALIEGMKNLEKRGAMRVKKLFVAGGGAQSDEVCRITASQFGLPVYRVQTHEATGIGAALAAFVARGFFSSHAEGVQEMVHLKDEFVPNEKEHRIYAELYEKIFAKVFNRLSPLYRDIDGIIGR